VIYEEKQLSILDKASNKTRADRVRMAGRPSKERDKTVGDPGVSYDL